MSTSQTSYFANDRPEVRAEIQGRFRTALDVGCGNGEVGRALMMDQKVEAFDGVELDPDAASRAEGVYRRVWTGTVESALSSPGSFSEPYDLILCADILEHLVDPWAVLTQLTAHLAPGGTVVVSIPNLKFAPVIMNLVFRGRFVYRGEGVLDRTHLRFFTRGSLEPMFAEAGLRIDSLKAKKSTRGIRTVLARALRDFGSAQFIVTARRGD